MEQQKKKNHSENIKGIIGGVVALLILMIAAMKFVQGSQEIIRYEIQEVLFEFSESIPEYTGINQNQIIRMTKDGIDAYNLKGEEIWTDTLTLDNPIVKQREPYFAVANMNDSRIHIFSDKGREGEIIVNEPILYFSINEKGDVAVIREREEGHTISAYNLKGQPISGSRTTYIKNAGFPIAVEVSNDSSMLIASYMDLYSPQVMSVMVGMPIGIEQSEVVDNISYGVEVRDNIIYDIEFITDDVWVAIGEAGMSYHRLSDGKQIATLPETYLMETPYVSNHNSKGYMSVVGKYLAQGNNTFGEQILWLYDKEGETVLEKRFQQPINFYKAGEGGVVIGQGNNYEGYNPKGVERFSFHATHNIEEIGYVNHELIALTKNEVFKLKRVQKGTEE